MKFIKTKIRPIPDGRFIVWRYLSLKHFAYLMKNESLYFTVAKNFTDKYEFTIPKRTLDKLSMVCDKNELEQKIEQFSEYRNSTFVNCWTRKRDESYLLWKIYLGGSHNGVAIKSTVSKLRDSLKSQNRNTNLEMYYADIKYADYIPPRELGLPTIAATKRRFYKGEDEVRLFFSVDGFLASNHLIAGIPLSVQWHWTVPAIWLLPLPPEA